MEATGKSAEEKKLPMKRILAVVAIIAIALSTVGVASERANATFKKSRVLDPEGKERKAELVFGGKTLTIHRKGHSDEVYSDIPYGGITSLLYERAKSARLKTALFLSPIALFSKGKKHWLTIEWTDNDQRDAAILRLDKKEYRAILGQISARADVKLVRVESK
jgi:hypothetical protein